MHPALAQTAPQFLVSWRALNYVPADYLGKIYPTRLTPVEAGFDLIDNGKIVNLANFNIRWFLDNDILVEGNSIKTVRFNARKYPGSSHNLRITVEEYKGGDVEYSWKISVKSPGLVIDSRHPNNQFSLGSYLLRALPYFFNASLQNLSFKWRTDGKEILGKTQNPDLLKLELGSAGKSIAPKEIRISAGVQNQINPIETIEKSLNLAVE